MLIMSGLMFFTSCITTHKVNYLQEPDNIIPSYKDSLVYEDYRLKTGDKVFLRVYSTNEITNLTFNASTSQSMNFGPSTDLYAYAIQQNGKITLPTIGEIEIGGQTLREAKRTVEDAIKPVYPVHTIDLHILNRYFSVIGSSGTGHYAMTKEKINIFQALAMAGDVDVYADRSKVRIIRETDQGTEVKIFDLRSKTIINSEYYYIEPNDVIYIQKLNEQFFSILNLPTLISTTFSTISFGAFLYGIII